MTKLVNATIESNQQTQSAPSGQTSSETAAAALLSAMNEFAAATAAAGGAPVQEIKGKTVEKVTPTVTQQQSNTALPPNMMQHNLAMYANLATPNNSTPAQKFEMLYAAEHAKAMAAFGMQQQMQQMNASMGAYGAHTTSPRNQQTPVTNAVQMVNPNSNNGAKNMQPQFAFHMPMAMPYYAGLMGNPIFMNVPVVPQPQAFDNGNQTTNVKPASNKKKRPGNSLPKSSKKAKKNGETISTPKAKARPGQTKPKARKKSTKGRASGKICEVEACSKLARSTTQFCAAHGGGRRCQHSGCTKSARGATNFCIAHGGGRRCKHLTCTKSAQGSTYYCIAHGGGRRCKFTNCEKSARGPTGYCKSHGGGRRCQQKGCYKCAADNSVYCRTHGGGKRCSHTGCSRAVRADQSFCSQHKQSSNKTDTSVGFTSMAKKTLQPTKPEELKLPGSLAQTKTVAKTIPTDNVVPLSAIAITSVEKEAASVPDALQAAI